MLKFDGNFYDTLYIKLNKHNNAIYKGEHMTFTGTGEISIKDGFLVVVNEFRKEPYLSAKKRITAINLNEISKFELEEK